MNDPESKPLVPNDFDGQLFVAWSGAKRTRDRVRAGAYAAILRQVDRPDIELWVTGASGIPMLYPPMQSRT